MILLFLLLLPGVYDAVIDVNKKMVNGGAKWPVRHDKIWYGTMLCGTAWHGMVSYALVRYVPE